MARGREAASRQHKIITKNFLLYQKYNRTIPWLTQQYGTPDNLDARVALHKSCSTDKGRWYEWVFGILKNNLSSEATLLEIGAGSGNLWSENRENIPQKWNITLTDQSRGMIEKNSQQFNSDQRFTLSVVDANEPLPFPDASFDAIIANHCLYHVENLQAVFTEAVRTLKLGGIFFASTVGEKHMQNLYDLLQVFNPLYIHAPNQHFTTQNGKALLALNYETPASGTSLSGTEVLFPAKKVPSGGFRNSELLGNHFTSVEEIPHGNRLVVDREHVPLLVEYVYSMQGARELFGDERKEELHTFFINQLNKREAISIEKEESIFICRK